MAKTAKKTISCYIAEDVANEVDARGDNRSATINRDLMRLYDVYRTALLEVKLTDKEACLITDACNGSLHDARSAQMLYGSVDDACRLDNLDKKWEVNNQDLVQKLHGLSMIQCLALIDAAERFWQVSSATQSSEEFEALIKKCFCIA
jgi:hypothetical protein